MATYKVLGQAAPAAATAGDLYTVGAGNWAALSTVTVCNRASTSTTYRIAVRPAGASLANTHYVVYDANLPANQTITLTIGLTLAATDVLTVQSASGLATFNAFGVENP